MNALQEHFSAKGLGRVFLLSLLADLVIRPFGQGRASTAQQMIPAALLTTAVTLALTAPLLSMARQAVLNPAEGGVPGVQKLLRCGLLCLLTVLFAMGGGEGIVRAGGFLRYVSADPLADGVVYVLLLAACAYAMWCGPQAQARAAGPLLCLFFASVALVIISNAGAMRAENLPAQPFDGAAVAETALNGFRFPAELALFFFFAPPAEGNLLRHYRQSLWGLCFVYIALTLTAGLVLGSQMQAQSQPVHTLARLGHLSVFRRLDALHDGVWTLAALAKAAAFASGLRQAAGLLLPQRRRRWAGGCALAALAAGTCACASLPYAAAEGILTVLTALAMGAMGMLGALYTKGGAGHGCQTA